MYNMYIKNNRKCNQYKMGKNTENNSNLLSTADTRNNQAPFIIRVDEWECAPASFSATQV